MDKKEADVMISLIEPIYKTKIMISPITPIYKAGSRNQPNQNTYVQDRKPKRLFSDVLNKEISMRLGSNISVRA